MAYREEIVDLWRGGFPLVWVQTCEADRLLEETRAVFAGFEIPETEDEHVSILAWDVVRGFQGNGTAEKPPTQPLQAIQKMEETKETVALFMNFNLFMGRAGQSNPGIVQALANASSRLKQISAMIVVVSPIVEVPVELDRMFVVVDHALPEREELGGFLAALVEDSKPDPEDPNDKRVAIEVLEKDAILDAGRGLTAFEFEQACALSAVRAAKFAPEVVAEQKVQMVRRSSLLSVHQGGDTFETLGGLASIKDFGIRAIKGSGGKAKACGILLLGVPGSGKSHFAKSLGAEVGRPTLVLDVGSMFGGIVGQSEQNIREALRVADAMAPAVLMIEEIEKGLSGAASSHKSDSGTTARVFGHFLSWLQDHESDVFVVASCNDLSKLPPEFSRQERWDAVFFVDLPTGEERAKIWDIWIRHYDLPEEVRAGVGAVDDESWTGAEIRSCCRLAALLDVDLVAASENVIPIAKGPAAQQVADLRKWAQGTCLSASYAGRYEGEKVVKPATKRRIRK